MQTRRVDPLRFYAETVVAIALTGLLLALSLNEWKPVQPTHLACKNQIDYVRNAPLNCASEKPATALDQAG
jgi:hypothetical protein